MKINWVYFFTQFQGLLRTHAREVPKQNKWNHTEEMAAAVQPQSFWSYRRGESTNDFCYLLILIKSRK